jgi:hypothetical protein
MKAPFAFFWPAIVVASGDCTSTGGSVVPSVFAGDDTTGSTCSDRDDSGLESPFIVPEHDPLWWLCPVGVVLHDV